MRGTQLLREGNVYIVTCSDTTYPSMKYLGMSEKGRYLHFHNTRNDTGVVFDQDHPHVIKSQWEITQEDILDLFKQS
jgi:hypothetical protein